MLARCRDVDFSRSLQVLFVGQDKTPKIVNANESFTVEKFQLVCRWKQQ